MFFFHLPLRITYFLFPLLSQSFSSCTTGDCVFNCGSDNCTTIICPHTANSCTVNCGPNECESSNIYLAGSTSNNIYCKGSNSCNNINAYCGIPDFDPGFGFIQSHFYGSIESCNFYLAGSSTNACSDGYFKCYHDINECKLYAQTDNNEFISSQFQCELDTNNDNNQCIINCFSSQSCGYNNTSSFNCHSDICQCKGDGCNALDMYRMDDISIYTTNYKDDDVKSTTTSTNTAIVSIPTEEQLFVDIPTTKPTLNPLSNTVSITTTMNSNNESINAKQIQTNTNLDYNSYIIVGSFFIIPTIIIIAAIIYHKNMKGSDRPNYFGVLLCFANIADFYTDTAFCMVLYYRDSILYIPAVIFTFGPHIISNLIGMAYIYRWRKHKIGYMRRFDNVIITFTVLAGFYPAVEFFSSKLFYLDVFSLHFSKKSKNRIKQFRFFNNIILENVPLMIIQRYSLAQNTKDNIILLKEDPITFIALFFSFLSLIIGLQTLISRACGKFNRTEFNENTKVKYKLEITSQHISKQHRHSYILIAETLCQSLKIEVFRIETLNIIPIINGISCHIKILLDDDEEYIAQRFNKITNNESKQCDHFKILLCHNLCIADYEDMQVSSKKIDGNVIDIDMDRLQSWNPRRKSTQDKSKNPLPNLQKTHHSAPFPKPPKLGMPQPVPSNSIARIPMQSMLKQLNQMLSQSTLITDNNNNNNQAMDFYANYKSAEEIDYNPEPEHIELSNEGSHTDGDKTNETDQTAPILNENLATIDVNYDVPKTVASATPLTPRPDSVTFSISNDDEENESKDKEEEDLNRKIIPHTNITVITPRSQHSSAESEDLEEMKYERDDEITPLQPVPAPKYMISASITGNNPTLDPNFSPYSTPPFTSAQVSNGTVSEVANVIFPMLMNFGSNKTDQNVKDAQKWANDEGSMSFTL